jgi:hypothetical protein
MILILTTKLEPIADMKLTVFNYNAEKWINNSYDLNRVSQSNQQS